MSFSLERARATIKKVLLDKKKDEDGVKTPTAALKIEVKASADILAEFHPSLRAAWFMRHGGVRFSSMKEVGWEGTRRGVDLAIRPGPDMKPAVTLQDVTLRDFKLKPIEEAGAQQVFMRFSVDLNDAIPPPIARLVEYLQEESWIDVHGGGELDLAPPSARSEIEGLEDEAPPAGGSGTVTPAPTYAVVKDADVASVRRLQPTIKGAQAKLKAYHDDVLRAAIAAETAAADARPMMISMLEAEIKRRHETH
jgi:hypothetical protein